ncbi:MAG: crotonase/enoyl-CoA hydratase family protein [Burkholderiales bacterium]|jgi:DSF synthase|nr:crotonase/enoyl-CoA hydratase family protein [Burkholderiales bacterium]
MNAIADVRYLSTPRFAQLETRFDRALGIYWAWMDPKPQHNFNPALLADIAGYLDSIENSAGTMNDDRGESGEIRYAVIASKAPGVYNLGGDLALFKAAIQRRDRAALVRYGRDCVDILYRWWHNCHQPITTISLVQGDALGGGFECALSTSVLVAEEDARMGFPEILFNLFPGMGAYSFLSRKVGRRITEELVTSGRMYSARELYDLGVVDVITPNGTGQAAVESYVRKHSRSGNGRRGIESVAREMNPLTHEELMRVVELWADAALKLSERDLRMMDRIVRAQQRRAGDDAVVLESAVSNVVPIAVGAGD